MTSLIATNAKPSVGKYLEADREGFPLQEQVATTIEEYSGLGAEIVRPSGKDVFFIGTTLTGGALTIHFDPIIAFVGKSIFVGARSTTVNDIIFTLPAGVTFSSTLAGFDTLTTETIAAGTAVGNTFHFINATTVLVE